jgi:hypothetical protein
MPRHSVGTQFLVVISLRLNQRAVQMKNLQCAPIGEIGEAARFMCTSVAAKSGLRAPAYYAAWTGNRVALVARSSKPSRCGADGLSLDNARLIVAGTPGPGTSAKLSSAAVLTEARSGFLMCDSSRTRMQRMS